ncbi:TPA: 30S ribosomal protein S21 [Candidatus Saccharibacteria bacterium]|nr:30S ribosomal protein S21 [Candidatus Saccharibacteria bacterium]HIO87195.1 30S ribosomal protein S21 [Candidatus Saccharibacteria bacterium]
MVLVTRKDGKESLENMIRRFNKRVAMSGVIAAARNNQYFEKPISKTERRSKAIIRNKRKAEKLRQIRLGK